jgi:3-dehydroquinate synthetase
MRVDKKVKAGRVRLILMQGIGRATLSADYPDAALAATLSEWFDGAAGTAAASGTAAAGPSR